MCKLEKIGLNFNLERLGLEDARWHIVFSRYTLEAHQVFDGSDDAVLYHT